MQTLEQRTTDKKIVRDAAVLHLSEFYLFLGLLEAGAWVRAAHVREGILITTRRLKPVLDNENLQLVKTRVEFALLTGVHDLVEAMGPFLARMQAENCIAK